MSIQLFSSYFCFLFTSFLVMLGLFVSFVVSIISLPLCFYMYISRLCIYTSTLSSMLVSPLIPSFLKTYSLSKSAQGFKPICIIKNWSICSNSSMVHFKNDPGYLMRGTTRVFTHLMRFMSCILFSSSFPFLLMHSSFFFHLHTIDGVHFQYSLVFVSFLFSNRLFFSWFACSIPFVIYHLSFFAFHY